jgi:hypothetical protein
MSNRCPHCGAEAGKSHDPCPYAPGGKKYKAPARQRPPSSPREIASVASAALEEMAPISRKPLTTAEVKAVAAKALEQTPKKSPSNMLRDVDVFIKKTPDPAERKSKVAELQTKAESVKAKAGRPQSRAGKKAATVWLSPDEMKRLQQASLDHGVPQERILAEGLGAMLAGKYK